MEGTTIFDFTKTSSLDNWFVVDDGVMGGRSAGQFSLTRNGYGLFEGYVSLENNGGFSSVRHRFGAVEVSSKKNIKIRLKGDGKKYQFRIKHNARDYQSYITYFETSGEWEEISIPLEDMYPSFRGRRLNLPNFSETTIEELAFLIANKKAENFALMIDWIKVE